MPPDVLCFRRVYVSTVHAACPSRSAGSGFWLVALRYTADLIVAKGPQRNGTNRVLLAHTVMEGLHVQSPEFLNRVETQIVDV